MQSELSDSRYRTMVKETRVYEKEEISRRVSEPRITIHMDILNLVKAIEWLSQ